MKLTAQNALKGSSGGAAAFRRLVAQARVPYRGLSLDVASRLGGALALVLLGLLLLTAVFEPPEGAAFEAVFLADIAMCGIFGYLLLSGRWVQSPNWLLGTSYITLLLLAVLVWTSSGAESLYSHLYLIPLICVAAIHPLKRWAAYNVMLVAAVLSPIVYDEFDRMFMGMATLQIILWLGLGLVILLMMSDMRAQRRQLEIEQSEASRLARLDSLTGLGNQRGFWESIHSEVAHAQRTYRPLSIVLADLDHFKRINDEFGHREGDELLARVGVALARTARTSDKCFRYGGEEFVVVLRDVDLAGAEIAAERFRTAVAEIQAPSGVVTMSCGVAELEPSMDAETLLRAADDALLSAKRQGRDRVVCAGKGNGLEADGAATL